MELNLKVASLEEANLLLKALGKLPLEESVDLWLRCRDQVMRQISPPPAEAPARARRGRPRTNGTAHPQEPASDAASP